MSDAAAPQEAWTASVVDLAWARVLDRLGAPASHDTRIPGLEEACFEVAAPYVARCVTFVDGVALTDRLTLQAPPEALQAGFDEAVARVSAALGAPERRVHFAFVKGEHVPPRLDRKGEFLFGEGCILATAMSSALAADPAGLAWGGARLAEAVASGTACLRAEWSGPSSGSAPGSSERAMVVSRELEAAASAEVYGVFITFESQDAARQQRRDEAMKASLERLRQRRKARQQEGAEGDGSSDGSAGPTAPQEGVPPGPTAP